MEGGLFMGGISVVAPDTLIPPLLGDLGAPDWLIAVSPQLMLLGFMVTPLFFAHLVEGRQRILSYLLFWGIFQRIPFLLAGIVLFGAAWFPDWCVMVAIAFAPFGSGLLGGVAVSAWSAMVAKTVAPERRASLMAIRNTVGAVLGIGAGFLVEWMLAVVPGTTGYAWLHIFAFALLMGSWLFFSGLRETTGSVPDGNPGSFLENLRSIPRTLREDRRFLRYLGALSCGHGILIILPFLSIHALKVLEAPTSFAGVLVAAKSAGVFAGNFLGAFLGDRFGGKSVFLTAFGSFFLVAVLSLVVESRVAFLLVFFLFGLGFTMRMVGQQTMTLELAPPARLPTYFALGLSGTAPFMLLAAGIATLGQAYGERIDAFWPLAVPSAIAIAASFVLMLGVREPRSRRGREVEGQGGSRL